MNVDLNNGIATITLNEGKVNAMGHGLLDSLNETLDTLARNDRQLKAQMLHAQESERVAHFNEERLQAVIDNAVDGLIIIDSAGIVEVYNPACRKMFGFMQGLQHETVTAQCDDHICLVHFGIAIAGNQCRARGLRNVCSAGGKSDLLLHQVSDRARLVLKTTTYPRD